MLNFDSISFSQTPTTVGQTVDKLKQEGTQQFYGNLQNYIQSSFARTEVSITAQQFNKPLFGILTTQPFIQSGNTTWFYQGSIFRTEEEGTMRNTVNLGTGVRELVYDKKVMLGANVFYDHEFPYDHQRVGFGLETRTSVGEINANQYLKSSGIKTNKYGFYEQIFLTEAWKHEMSVADFDLMIWKSYATI